MLRYEGVRVIVDESRFLLEQSNMALVLYLACTYTNKPFVQCLRGPSGRNMLEDSPADHVHHHGVWWGHGDVNGVDFYLEVPRSDGRFGRIEHREWAELTDASPRYGFVEALEWVDDAGRPLIAERRSLHVHLADEAHYTVDLDSTYTACVDIRFGDTKESVMPSLRLAETITTRGGGGAITSSRGGVGEEQTMGVEAEWVDYSSTRRSLGGKPVTEGVAVLDHPSNPLHPPKFFCREYGPLAPWQGNYFTGPSELRAGDSLRGRHRLVVHEGDVREADIAGKYARYLQEVPFP